ncbi:MAG: hypothetical protein A2075_23850 [Geobacteraceae bacterium GWC2_58_44]|nr:MAG: hypothetical protein A2075_23850 [Geobacteraceae bacterium GWC2_58_44]
MTKTRSNIITKPEGVQHAIVLTGNERFLMGATILVLEIFEVFKKLGVERMSATKILRVLRTDTTYYDWTTFCDGKKLNLHRLDSMLSAKGIRSHDIRFKKGVKKCYFRMPFEYLVTILCHLPLPKDM